MTKLEKAIEACWLAAASLVPAAFLPSSWAFGGVEGPKIFVLRSITFLLLVLLSMEWARQPHSIGSDKQKTRLALVCQSTLSIAHGLRSQPIVIGAAAVTAVTILSTVLSPLMGVSFFGTDPGRDTYGLFSIASYIVIFTAVATHLRTGVQLRRLIWVVTISSALLGLYGIEEHFGIGAFDPPVRISMTFGNPIFGAAYLLLTIPLTIALWQGWRDRYGALTHIVAGAGLIALQTTAFGFTLSRGAILSLMLAFIVFLAFVGLVMGVRAIGRPAASVAIAVGIAFAAGYIPVPGSDQGTGQLAARLSTVPAEMTASGGLSERYGIWRVAARIYVSTPWVDTEQHPEIPPLTLAPLRPLIGYGPDSFIYVFSLQGDDKISLTPWHAHNFIVQTAIELGLLGLLAYAMLAMATALALLRMLLAASRGETSPWMAYIVLGLIGVFAGRLLEQMAGKGQVADLTQTWIMLGIVFAMARMPASQWIEPLTQAPATSKGKLAQPRIRTSPKKCTASLGVTHFQNRLRIVIVVSAALLALVFWWQTVVTHVHADYLAGQANAAEQAGQFSTARTLARQAVNRSPSSTYPRISLARALIDTSRLQAGTDAQIAMLQDARNVMNVPIDRNPLDYRAWTILSEITRKLADLDSSFGSDSLAVDETTAALRPGFRPALENLALTLVILKRYDEALEITESARVLAAIHDDPHGHYLSYITALALHGLSRIEDAEVIALGLSDWNHPNARALLDAFWAGGR